MSPPAAVDAPGTRPEADIASGRLSRSAATTARTLAAAEQLLTRLGERFTLQEVAELARVSLTSIYARFESKEGLIEAVQDVVLTRIEQNLAASLAAIGGEGGGIRWTVSRLVEAFLRSSLQNGQIIDRLQTIGHYNQNVRNRGLLTFERTSGYAQAALMCHAGDTPDAATQDKAKRIFQVFLYALTSYVRFEEVYNSQTGTSHDTFRADCEAMLTMSLEPLFA